MASSKLLAQNGQMRLVSCVIALALNFVPFPKVPSLHQCHISADWTSQVIPAPAVSAIFLGENQNRTQKKILQETIQRKRQTDPKTNDPIRLKSRVELEGVG